MDNSSNEVVSSTSTSESSNSVNVKDKLIVLEQKLKKMADELPPEIRCKFSEDLLKSLAQSLVDNNVFRIVKSLMEIQHYTEKHLFQMRLNLTVDQSLEIQDMLINISDDALQFNQEMSLKVKHKKELKEMDERIVLQLDDRVHDQQKFLEKANVPGFEITDDPEKIQIQMRILDFIIRLSQSEVPS